MQWVQRVGKTVNLYAAGSELETHKSVGYNQVSTELLLEYKDKIGACMLYTVSGHTETYNGIDCYPQKYAYTHNAG